MPGRASARSSCGPRPPRADRRGARGAASRRPAAVAARGSSAPVHASPRRRSVDAVRRAHRFVSRRRGCACHASCEAQNAPAAIQADAWRVRPRTGATLRDAKSMRAAHSRATQGESRESDACFTDGMPRTRLQLDADRHAAILAPALRRGPPATAGGRGRRARSTSRAPPASSPSLVSRTRGRDAQPDDRDVFAYRCRSRRGPGRSRSTRRPGRGSTIGIRCGWPRS